MEKILVVGGGGYLGSVLVPFLLSKGYYVRVLDIFWFGNFLPFDMENLNIIKGDMRNEEIVRKSLQGIDKVILLASLSNDPSSDIEPELTREINYYATKQLIFLAHEAGVKRFVFASSSSVYGIKTEEEVVEDLTLKPISLYSELKVRIEDYLFGIDDDNFVTTAVRSATICGYSPRFRLDLLVNILTVSAMQLGRITVDGGEQIRANVHIKDIANFYITLLEADKDLVHKEPFNINDSNFSVLNMARKVESKIDCEITFSGCRDPRSYSLSDKKARKVLGFSNQFSIDQAISDIITSYNEGRIRIMDDNCYNIKKMLLLGIDYLKRF